MTPGFIGHSRLSDNRPYWYRCEVERACTVEGEMTFSETSQALVVTAESALRSIKRCCDTRVDLNGYGKHLNS